MAKIYPTVDEALETIKRSNLPNLVTEGRDDYIIFRRLEEHLDGGISVLPVGGKDKVLQIFDRRHEIGHDRVAFVVDRDLWCFGAIPDEYKSDRILLTDGYSIENDVFRDADVKALMSNDERVGFATDLQRAIRWYSLAICRIGRGESCRIDVHPNELFDVRDRFAELTELAANENYPEPLFEAISRDPEKLLRGKTLFELAMRQLSATGRIVKHHHHQIMDTASVRRGPLLNSIKAEAERLLL